MTDKSKQKYKDYQKQHRENKTDAQKQKMKDYRKEYRKNITDEQKQKYKEARKNYITETNIIKNIMQKKSQIIKNNHKNVLKISSQSFIKFLK